MAIISQYLEAISMFKPLMAGICVWLMLCAVGLAQVPVAVRQDAENCDSTFTAADRLFKSEDPETLAKVVSLYEDALACIGHAPTERRAKTLMRIARLQLVLNQYDQALDNLDQALNNLQQLGNQDSDVSNDKAIVFGNQAYAKKILGEFDPAILNFERALALFKELGDKHREAYTLEQIGLVYALRGETDDALTSYADALALRRQIDSSDLKNQQQIAAIFDLKGRVYAQLNDFDRAATKYQKALVIARKTQYYQFVALTLNDIGVLKLKQNQPLSAKSYHLQALSELQRHGAEAKAVGETRTLLADAQTALGIYDAASQNYHRGLELQKGAKDTIGQAQTYFSLGMFEVARKEGPQAIKFFALAAKFYGTSTSPIGESNAWFQMAKALDAQRKDAEAKTEVAKAIELAEKVREFIPDIDLKSSYFTTVEQMYRFEIGLLLKNGGDASEPNQREAFDLFQRAQSRTLVDALGEKVHSDLLGAGNQEILGSIQEHEEKLAVLLHTPVKDGNGEDIFQAIKAEDAALKQIAIGSVNRDPRLGLFSNVVSARDIKQRIVDQDSALVQFYLAEPRSYAWIITQSKIDFVTLPSRKSLERDVKLALQFGMVDEWTNSQQAALERFRQDLMPVFDVARKKRWIVVPDGALHLFPFTILTSFKPQDQRPEEIVKIPSASAMDMIRRTSNPTRPLYALAIFADPVFDDLDSRVTAVDTSNTARLGVNTGAGTQRSQTDRNRSLPRLRYTLREAQQLIQLFPAGQFQSFLQFAATRDAVLANALRDFKIIHLATHSLANERHPELSKVIFSQVAKDGSPLPGELFAKDIYRMKLSADLVVLSSCKGAIGKQRPGEGPMSLSRAFLFAGSKAVVASLWEVNDEATAELMKNFYRHMIKDHLPPSTALSMAQLEFRNNRDKRLRNPYYWAGFELYGEWMMQ
jgi:tetratricopeptide (TPR) repeat protein